MNNIYSFTEFLDNPVLQKLCISLFYLTLNFGYAYDKIGNSA